MDVTRKPSQQKQDEAAQSELTHLERQFRAMRKDREACPEDVRAVLSKQKKVIKILEEEKNQLLNEISSSNTKPFVKAQEKINDDVMTLLTEHDELEQEIEKKSNDLKDLQRQINLVKEKVQRIKKEKRLFSSNTDEISKEERVDENLETRLHVEASKFSEKMIENVDLRREVEDLLHERSRFEKHFKSLSTELATGKKIIFDLIEQGTIAYDQRKEAEVRLNALKTKAKHELLNNCSEVQKIQRRVEHGVKLNQFIGKKSQKRISENTIKEKVAKQEEATKEMEEYLDKYSTIVNDIKEQFDESDFDQLVMQFMKLEEDNYNIYSFINELNKKLDAMRDEVCKLHAQIAQQRELSRINDTEWANILENLENEVDIKTQIVKGSRENLQKSKENVSTLLSGIQEVFNTVSCDPGPIRQMLGKNSSVTPDNVFLYLKSLESKLLEMSTVASYQQQRTTPRKSRSARSVMSFAKKAPKTVLPSQPCPLCAEVRDISEVDESVAVPLDTALAREQLREDMKTGLRGDLVHSVSECRLPKSRRIMQKRQN